MSDIYCTVKEFKRQFKVKEKARKSQRRERPLVGFEGQSRGHEEWASEYSVPMRSWVQLQRGAPRSALGDASLPNVQFIQPTWPVLLHA